MSLHRLAEDDELEHLAVAAYYAITAGVSLTLADWVRFDPAERAAWVEASRRIRVEELEREALARSGPLGPAAVRAEIDGGDSLADTVVEQAAEACARRVANA